MEDFINQYLQNIKDALVNNNIELSDLVAFGCRYCPLKEKCGKAADAGDNRECTVFIREEAK